MKILILTHSFNSLTQRVWVYLTEENHDVSVEFDIHHDITREAVRLFQPDLILGTYLKRKLPDDVIQSTPTLIIHPGPPGDRGPNSLDWAILNEKKIWGLTLLKATSILDGGPIYSYRYFKIDPERSKSSHYRQEVTEAAIECLSECLDKIKNNIPPVLLENLQCDFKEVNQKPLPDSYRRILPEIDSTEMVKRKILSADSFPGAPIRMNGQDYYVFNPDKNSSLKLKTRDGEIGVTHVQAPNEIKLPASVIFNLPNISPIHYEISGKIGFLHFPFYNGAFSTDDCLKLKEKIEEIQNDNCLYLILCGGPDFFSNGIHLNVIENSENPADESLRNINAMNDLVLSLLQTTNKITISALQGNAGAGGVYFALASDFVWAKENVILSPHYKNMGNLYGSEYWTYLLDRRVNAENAKIIREHRLPLSAKKAKALGLIDQTFSNTNFLSQVEQACLEMSDPEELIYHKKIRRQKDEEIKPLAKYREEELEKMKVNFYGFDQSYHVARSNFVRKVRPSRTPLYLAKHRKPH